MYLNIISLRTFYLTEESDKYQEYATEINNLTIASGQLMEERHKLDTYSLTCVIRQVTNTNTRVGSLMSTSHHKGILTSLIHILVTIHNSFIAAYAQLSHESNRYIDIISKSSLYFIITFRRERTIPLTLLTSHHLINYTDKLENIIKSNAQQSFQIGEGRLVSYNFSDIQRDFCDCFMIDKPSIEDDLDVRVTESRVFDNLKTIQTYIPQVCTI